MSLRVVRALFSASGRLGLASLPAFQKGFSWLASGLRPESGLYDVQGVKMLLDGDARQNLGLTLAGVYEPFETKFVKGYLKKGDVALDLGAHIGYYTLLLARLVGDGGRVYAFEPNPQNFALLETNVALNEFSNVTLIPKAVSSEKGRARLYLSERHSGMHRIYRSALCAEPIEIEAVRLDDYFEHYRGAIDFIKMDIEGAEGSALAGMKRLLESNGKVTILTEFSPPAIREAGGEPGRFLEALRDLGFRLFRLGRRGLSPVELDQALARVGRTLAAVDEALKLFQRQANRGGTDDLLDSIAGYVREQGAGPLVESLVCSRAGPLTGARRQAG